MKHWRSQWHLRATGDGPVRLLRSEAGEVKRAGDGVNVHRRLYDFQAGF